MVSKVFLDTDVIIDFLIDRQPHATSSSEIFELAESQSVELFTSALCLNNVHYIIKKFLGETRSREVITELLEMIDVLDVSKKDIIHALNSDFGDFKDAIQHSVAKNTNGIKSIVTRNTKDYRTSDISVFSPDVFVDMMRKG